MWPLGTRIADIQLVREEKKPEKPRLRLVASTKPAAAAAPKPDDSRTDANEPPVGWL